MLLYAYLPQLMNGYAIVIRMRYRGPGMASLRGPADIDFPAQRKAAAGKPHREGRAPTLRSTRRAGAARARLHSFQ
jgi:hypothetical protein